MRNCMTKNTGRKTNSTTTRNRVAGSTRNRYTSQTKKTSDKGSKTGTTRRTTRQAGSTASKQKKRKAKMRFKRVLLLGNLFVLTIILIGLIWFYLSYGKTITEYQSFAKKVVGASDRSTFSSSLTSIVYDVDGNILSTLKGEKDVYYIDYKDIPKNAVNAMIAIEDKKFMTHGGFDYLANVRAAIALIKEKGKVTQGGSTITQQLSRNIFLTHEVSIERKLKEIFISVELEKKYTKSEIMEFYLNNIYFANGYYGIQAASNGYFSKGVDELSLSEIAFLCAIPNNPTVYDPISHKENTIKRRNRILEEMQEDGKITKDEYEAALAEDIELKVYKVIKQNYVETYVYRCAVLALMKEHGFVFQEKFDTDEEKKAYEDEYYETYHTYQASLYTAGYRIYTSIDSSLQQKLQTALDEKLAGFTEVSEEGVYTLQGAAVCINNTDGRVAAIVGGRSQDFKGYTLNRAYQSYRQPGSSIKPLVVYAPILERGYDPKSKVVDEKFKGGPKNSNNTYEGEITLQRAVEASKNTIAWKLFEELTPSVGLSYLQKMNFQKIVSTDYVPAASLGGLTYGVSPLEMAAGYATLCHNGNYRDPSCIIKITDSEENVIVSDASAQIRIYEESAAKVMTEMLEGVIKNGTGKGLGVKGVSCAGKTGTTDEKKDGWFVGYTPYYTTSVWVGYDIPKTLSDLYGSSYPGKIWSQFMNAIHTSDMDATFEHFDWKAVRKEQEEKQKAEEEAKKEEEELENELEDTDVSEDTIPDDLTEGDGILPGEEDEEIPNGGLSVDLNDYKGEQGAASEENQSGVSDSETNQNQEDSDDTDGVDGEEPWEYDDEVYEPEDDDF